MLPERLRLVGDGQGGDVLAVRIERAFFRDVVLVQRRQREVFHPQRVFAEKLVQVPGEHAAVNLIRHAPAVVRLADEVLERVPGRLFVRVQVRLQNVVRHGVVRVVEVVRDVDAQLAELAPLQHHGVEVSEREEQLGVLGARTALGEGLLRDAGLVQAREVGAQPLGGLGGHLEPPLQDRQREVRGRVGREPQAEPLVRRRVVEALDDLLQLGQPREH